MPSFGQLIANAAPNNGHKHIEAYFCDLENVLINTPPFIKSTLTFPGAGEKLAQGEAKEKISGLPLTTTTLQRSVPARSPPKKTHRHPIAILQKPLPPPPPAAPRPDSPDSSSVPDLINSLDGRSSRSSRTSSVESFSHLIRAGDEIDLLLPNLKTLPIQDDYDMDGGIECLRLPGMWSEDAYAPVPYVRPLSLHNRPTNMTGRRMSIETFLTAASHTPIHCSEEQRSIHSPDCVKPVHDITPLTDVQITDLMSELMRSDDFGDHEISIHELAAECTGLQQPCKLAPSYDSLFGVQTRGDKIDDHKEVVGELANTITSLVSPVGSGTSAFSFEEGSVSRFSYVVELPADVPTRVESRSNSLHGSDSASSLELHGVNIAELPGESVSWGRTVLKNVSRRENSVSVRSSSRHEERRAPQALVIGNKQVQPIVVEPNHSDSDLTRNGTGQRRPWKGKGKLPPIRTIMWDDIPQEEVGSFCNAFNPMATDGRAGLNMQTMARSLAAGAESSDVTPVIKIGQSRMTAHADGPRVHEARDKRRPREPIRVSPVTRKKVDNEVSQQTLAVIQQIKILSEKVTQNDSQLLEDLRQMKDLFQTESKEIARKLQEKQAREEAEAMAAAAKLRDELEAQEKKEREDRLAAQRALIRIECVVCGDEKSLDDYPSKPPTSKCQHECKICLVCLDSWVASALKDNGTDGIKCPECPEKLAYQDVQFAASPVTFEAYDKAATLFALSSLPEFNWCLAPGCGYGQLNVGNNNYMQCVSCNYKQCLKHQEAWHTGESCAQYDSRTNSQKAKDEAKTIAMLDTVSKVCPGKDCGWRIQKTDGCDHITCRKCRHEFCWQCMASHKEIKRVGNTAHAKNCKFHSDNLEIAWPFNRH